MVDIKTGRAEAWERELSALAPELDAMEREFTSAMHKIARGSDRLVPAYATAMLGLQNFLRDASIKGDRIDAEKLDEVVARIDGSPIKGLVRAAGRFMIKAQEETTVPAEMIWEQVARAGNDALIQQMSAPGYN